jgi:transcription initiation factor TFIIH subunit 1
MPSCHLDLQQSPATSAKVSLKIVVQPPGAAAPENHVFTLTSPTNARAELTAIIDPLKEIIAGLKAGTAPPVASHAAIDGGGSSAAMAIAQAVTSGSRASEEDMYSDGRLLSNLGLQKSLLGANPVLRQRFDESLKGKPDVITMAQFSAQFWSTRTHLLRAHAVEKSQNPGLYNVLSEVKPTHVDGVIHLDINREQIHLIFDQQPLVRRIYDDLVPKKFSETDFWSKFVVSRLFKQLKGEKITELDPEIPLLDKYLNYNEDANRTRQFVIEHVPRFMDLEGNEQNHSKRMGNAPDTTMKPNSHEKVPILRIINNMSERMMVNVAPSDAEAHAPVGLDEETFNELQLRDLQRLDSDNRVRLHITDQQHISSKDRAEKDSAKRKADPGKTLKSLKREVALELILPTDPDGEDERRAGATSVIMKSVKQRVHNSLSNATSETGLSSTAVESATMSHNTTIEFLHYFWTVYLSGDEARANELAQLAVTLKKSLERIEAVAVEAEQEKTEEQSELKRQQDEFFQRTGKKRRLGIPSRNGGRRGIESMLAATTRAVRFAAMEYERVYSEQTAQQGLQVP